MSAPINFPAIAAVAVVHAAELVPRWLPSGTREGNEWISCNPKRDDANPGSFKINLLTGNWADFATDDRGSDLISLAAMLHDISQTEAATYLAAAIGLESPANGIPEHLKASFALVGDGEPVVLVDDSTEGTFSPADCGPADRFLRGSRFGRLPDGIWHYRTASGKVALAVCRWNVGGEKYFLNASPYDDGTGNTTWRWKSMSGIRPLFDLPKILDNPNAGIVICEGEKARDALERMLPNSGFIATCWAGGANAVNKTDWTPLVDRPSVWIWPDNDISGEHAAAAIESKLPLANTLGARAIQALRQVKGPLPQGFDAADLEAGGVTKLTASIFNSAGSGSLEIFDVCDLMNDHPEMKPALVHGMLRRGEVCNVIGAPKTGKSWLVMNLAISISTGREWLGFPCERGRVLIIDNELHPETLAARLRQVVKAMGLEPSDIRGKIDAVCLRGKLAGLDTIAKELTKLQPGVYDVAIVDALYRAMPAKTEENSNSDMRDVYNLLDQTAARMQTAFICVHHSSKGKQNDKGVTDVGAGAGATSRAADAHVVLRQHQDPGKIVMEAACRSWPTPKARVLEWSEEGRWLVDPDADPTRLAGSKETGETAPVSLLGLLTDEPRPIASLAAQAKRVFIKKQALDAALAEEEYEGRAFSWKNQKGKVVWSRKPKPGAAPKADKAGAIVAYRHNNPAASVAEIAKAVGASETYVRQRLPAA